MGAGGEEEPAVGGQSRGMTQLDEIKGAARRARIAVDYWSTVDSEFGARVGKSVL
jgi:hypothetical protein